MYRIYLSIFSILHFWKWRFIVIYTDKRPNRPTQQPISYPMHFAPHLEVQPRCGQSQGDELTLSGTKRKEANTLDRCLPPLLNDCTFFSLLVPMSQQVRRCKDDRFFRCRSDLWRRSLHLALKSYLYRPVSHHTRTLEPSPLPSLRDFFVAFGFSRNSSSTYLSFLMNSPLSALIDGSRLSLTGVSLG